MRGELIVAEPRGRYSARPPLVTDCSVLAALLFDEADRDTAAMALAGRDLFAPDLIDHELANVAVKKSGNIPDELIAQALDAFVQLDLTRHRVSVGNQWNLARRFQLSTCDAAYLAVSAELKSPLVTFDRRLGEAARRLLSQD